MKASENTLLQLVGGLRQWVMPVFQRYYTWDKKNWQQLWDDIIALLDGSSADQERRHLVNAEPSLDGLTLAKERAPLEHEHQAQRVLPKRRPSHVERSRDEGTGRRARASRVRGLARSLMASLRRER